MASIDNYKGRYRARWRDPNGRSRSRVFDTKRDVRRHLAKIESTKAEGAYIDPAHGRQTFESYATDWAKAQDWKASYRHQFGGFLARVRDIIGGMRLADIDRLAVERCRAELAARHAHGTVAVTMRMVKSILRHAHASGRIPRDPTIGVASAPKKRADDVSGRVTPEMVPTTADVLSILQAAPDGWRAAVALGIAGLRIGEVLGMRADRLGLDRRQVTVDAQSSYVRGQGGTLTTTKNETVRTITVSQLVAIELRRHLRDGHGGTWTDGDGIEHEMLFLRPDGSLWPPTSFGYAAWRPTLTEAGMAGRFRFHSLRHFCASSLLAEGVDVATVAGHLGDVPQTVMRTYAHWLRDRQDVPADVLDGILTPVRDTAVTQIAEIQSERP